MSASKDAKFTDRLNTAAQARKAMLEKFRAKPGRMTPSCGNARRS